MASCIERHKNDADEESKITAISINLYCYQANKSNIIGETWNANEMTKWCLQQMKMMVYYKYKRAIAHKVG